MFLGPKWVLLGLVTAAVAFAALPATALADFTASLSLDQTAGTTAGSSPAIGFDAKFASTTRDTVKSTTITLPPGLLTNESIAGGACLLSGTPNPVCQFGTGTLSLAGGSSQSVSVDLVKPPNPADIGGLAFVSGTAPLTTSDVTLGASGGVTVVSNLAAGITETDFSFTDLRLPSSCPSPAATVTMTAVSQAGVSAAATAPLNVTGCGGQTYQPALSASITKDAHDAGGELVLGITQGATEAASKTITLGLGSSVTPNVGADLGCLSGTACTIGTATATSPLLPSAALASGTVTLGGSVNTPTIAVSFPAPFAMTLDGAVNLATNSVTFSNVPDLPLTSLTLTVTGPSGQKAFNITSCAPATVTGSFTGQGNQSSNSSAAIKFSNCPNAPKASGSSSGLATGHPSLRVKVSHSSGGANIASLAVGLPSGLSFARSAISTHKTCTTTKGKKKCTTTTLIKGLGVSGGNVKSVALKGGKLVITLKKAVGSVTVSLSGPVLSESKVLQTKVKKHKGKTVTVTLKVTDAKHTTTSVPVELEAH